MARLALYKTMIQHFILTRFNLCLWNKDKEGNPVRTAAWLEHRFSLFEKYSMNYLYLYFVLYFDLNFDSDFERILIILVD